jgi:hypothetical protein
VTDADAVASAGLRLRSLAPVVTALPSVGWSGRAAAAAEALAEQTRAAELPVRQTLAEAGQVLTVTASALAAAAALSAAATRIEDPTDPTAGRLRADAAAQVAAADRLCAARLRALLDLPLLPLPPLASVTDPEQRALTGFAAHGWAAVPAALLGPIGALTSAASAEDLTAPVAAREAAARAVLARIRPALLRPGPGGAPRTYLEAGSGGDVAEVWGDVSSARTVVVLVPGTQTSARRFGGAQQQGDATYDELRRQAGPDVAVVSWLGSPEPSTVVAAAEQSYAKHAAPRLIRFVQSLPTVPGVRLTLVGHSYGAVVTGLAVRGGLRPDALIGVAPAGFGPGVHTAADLDGVPVYVTEDSRDPIKDEYAVQGLLQDVLGNPIDRLTGAIGIGHLGDDPRCLPGATELVSGHDGHDGWPLGFDLPLHGAYFTPGGAALHDIVAVAVGGDITVAPPGSCR